MFKVHIVGFDKLPEDTQKLKQFLSEFAKGVREDFVTTNNAVGGAARMGAGALSGSVVAGAMKSNTLPQWIFRRMGPLPAEFTKYGKYQVWQWSKLTRLGHVLKATATNALFVFVAWNGGVLIGSVINQFIPQKTKDLIGATLYEIIHEGGWKNLWENPFGWKYWAPWR